MTQPRQPETPDGTKSMAFVGLAVEHPFVKFPCLHPGDAGVMGAASDALRLHSDLNTQLALAKAAAAGVPQSPWLVMHGCVKKPSSDGLISGETFLKWLVGPFWRASDDPWGLCRVPAAVCAGRNKKREAAISPALAARKMVALDVSTRDRGASRASGDWLAPFPLVHMLEGKNRIDMYLGVPGSTLLMEFSACAFAPAKSLKLQRVLGTTDVVMLHCDHPHFLRGGSTVSPAALPFPALSLPLLQAYGVTWKKCATWLVPSSPQLAGYSKAAGDRPLPLGKRFLPSSWQRMVVEQGYD